MLEISIMTEALALVIALAPVLVHALALVLVPALVLVLATADAPVLAALALDAVAVALPLHLLAVQLLLK